MLNKSQRYLHCVVLASCPARSYAWINTSVQALHLQHVRKVKHATRKTNPDSVQAQPNPNGRIINRLFHCHNHIAGAVRVAVYQGVAKNHWATNASRKEIYAIKGLNK